VDGLTFRMEGLEQTVRNLGDLPKATRRNVVRRVLMNAGEPTADRMASLAPVERGILAFSIVVSSQLTRRHRGEKLSEVEVHIGPAGGQGALFYASHKEFGTILSPAEPYARPAWESTKGLVFNRIADGLGAEVMKAAARLGRKSARLDSNTAMIRARLGA
jgi:HK97 gp10 family phage protein